MGHPQIIRTESGEELVVLSRREYDALLARLGNEDAEDRMTLRIADEMRARIAAGQEDLLPEWLVQAMIGGDTPIRAARRRAGLSQVELAEAVGITQGYLSDLERGSKKGDAEVIRRIAAKLDVDSAWLRNE